MRSWVWLCQLTLLSSPTKNKCIKLKSLSPPSWLLSPGWFAELSGSSNIHSLLVTFEVTDIEKKDPVIPEGMWALEIVGFAAWCLLLLSALLILTPRICHILCVWGLEPRCWQEDAERFWEGEGEPAGCRLWYSSPCLWASAPFLWKAGLGSGARSQPQLLEEDQRLEGRLGLSWLPHTLGMF